MNAKPEGELEAQVDANIVAYNKAAGGAVSYNFDRSLLCF